MKRCAYCLDEVGTNGASNRDCPVCRGESAPSQDAAALPRGTWLVGHGESAGRYVLGRVLGSGGFGITYLGLHLQLGQKVAIKELFPRETVHRTADNTVVARSGGERNDFQHLRRRFVEEARTLSHLPDDGRCVRALDIVEANGTAYMIMEYVQGHSLRELRQREGGRLDVGLVHWLGEELAQALTHLHAHGLVHRDIAPDNAMLTPQRRVKLIDFGAARFVTEGGASRLSRVWKDGYAPPEQMAEEGAGRMPQGPWTDVYALGATLYELLGGQRPPDAVTRFVTGAITLRPSLDAIQTLHPKAAPLCDAIERALQLDAIARPQDGAAFLALLGATRPPVPAPSTHPLPWRWIAVAGLLAGLLLAGGYWLGRGEGQVNAEAFPSALADGDTKTRPDAVEGITAPRLEPLPHRAQADAGAERIALDVGQSSDRRELSEKRQSPATAQRDEGPMDTLAEPTKASTPAGPKPVGPAGYVLVESKGRSFTMSLPDKTRVVRDSAYENDEIAHRVTFTYSFWMKRTETTQAEWDSFAADWRVTRHASAKDHATRKEARNPSEFSTCGPNCPVDSVTWCEAVEYTNWLSRKEGLQECYNLLGCSGAPGVGRTCEAYRFAGLRCSGYRLPTEAEWEYAALGRGIAGPEDYPPTITATETGYSPELERLAVYGCASSEFEELPSLGPCKTARVATKASNPIGLYDTLGNVSEWCHDAYRPSLGSSPQTDPVVDSDGLRLDLDESIGAAVRVMRGCSWRSLAEACRVQGRGNECPNLTTGEFPGAYFDDEGFRPVRTVPD